MAKKHTITTTVNERHVITLTQADLWPLLNKAGYNIPSDASFQVRVPGGGDWSNMNLDIDGDCPLVIEWTTESVTEG